MFQAQRLSYLMETQALYYQQVLRNISKSQLTNIIKLLIKGLFSGHQQVKRFARLFGYVRLFPSKYHTAAIKTEGFRPTLFDTKNKCPVLFACGSILVESLSRC